MEAFILNVNLPCKRVTSAVFRSPVQVRYMKQGTQSRCTGTTHRDGTGREVGGGFGMGDTGTPVADSCQCMAKTTTIF